MSRVANVCRPYGPGTGPYGPYGRTGPARDAPRRHQRRKCARPVRAARTASQSTLATRWIGRPTERCVVGRSFHINMLALRRLAACGRNVRDHPRRPRCRVQPVVRRPFPALCVSIPKCDARSCTRSRMQALPPRTGRLPNNPRGRSDWHTTRERQLPDPRGSQFPYLSCQSCRSRLKYMPIVILTCKASLIPAEQSVYRLHEPPRQGRLPHKTPRERTPAVDLRAGASGVCAMSWPPRRRLGHAPIGRSHVVRRLPQCRHSRRRTIRLPDARRVYITRKCLHPQALNSPPFCCFSLACGLRPCGRRARGGRGCPSAQPSGTIRPGR